MRINRCRSQYVSQKVVPFVQRDSARQKETALEQILKIKPPKLPLGLTDPKLREQMVKETLDSIRRWSIYD